MGDRPIRSSTAWLAAPMLAIAVAACGGGTDPLPVETPSPHRASAEIDAAGGAVETPDGDGIELPAGALAGPSRITIDTEPAPAIEGLASELTVIGPAGLALNQPARLQLHYDPARLAAGAGIDALRVVRVGADGLTEQPLLAADAAAKRLTAEVNRLGRFALIHAGSSALPQAPRADAGADRTVALGAEVSLDGSKSSDLNGDPLSFAWRLVRRPPGSGAELIAPETVTPRFVADRPGQYLIGLSVDDGRLRSPLDLVFISTENSPPAADAGPDRSVATGATVLLDGSASSDVDGDRLRFNWSLLSRPEGSAASIGNPAAVRPRFVADAPGSFVAELVVSDGDLDSEADTVLVSSTPASLPPIAVAGDDRTARTGERITLDGSASSDPDGDRLQFAWSFLAVPAGSRAAFDDPEAVQPGFTVDAVGDYRVQLRVSDGTQSDTDTLTINALNSAPVADAGADQSGFVDDTVVLDGSGSTDPDGDALSFRWALLAQPEGSRAALDDPASVTPSFVLDAAGTYIGQLIVTDSRGADSAPDTVTVSTENSPPVADAGPDQELPQGSAVQLSGAASGDADGDPLSFRWSFTSVPQGSTARLATPTGVSTGFTADRPGLFVIQLIVNDGQVDSAADTVVVRSLGEPPQALSIEPPSGRSAGGDTVVIRGSEFEPGTRVFFAGVEATVLERAFDRLRVRTPAGAPNTLADVDIDNGSGVATLAASFRYGFPFSAPGGLGVPAGGSATFDLVLDAPAAGNTVVSLSSSDASVVSLPAELVIPAGSDRARIVLSGGSFGRAVVTVQVGNQQLRIAVFVNGPPLDDAGEPLAVTIAGTTAGALLLPVERSTIAPVIGMLSLPQNPNQVFALPVGVAKTPNLLPIVALSSGASTTLSAELSAPAPAGGLTVTITLVDPAVGVITESSVFVPEGQRVFSFEVTGDATGRTRIVADAGSEAFEFDLFVNLVPPRITSTFAPVVGVNAVPAGGTVHSRRAAAAPAATRS